MNPNLWVRTSYTFFSSFLDVDRVIKFAKLNNYKEVSLIEKNVLYSAYTFYSKARANGLKPIIGLEIDIEGYQKILIAKNYEGYKILILISSLINTKAKFDSKIINENVNNIIILEKEFPIHSYLEDEDKEDLVTFATENNFKINNEKIEKLLTTKEFQEKYGIEILKKIENIYKEVNLEFPKIEMSFPDSIFSFSKESIHEILRGRIVHNLQSYLSQNLELDKNIYLARINYEFKIIADMHFETYFLMVEDIVKFAKENNILVGPGRGSAAGSLIVFLLNITEIDPIKNNLIFERFLNPMRISMPDIDIDFEDTRRDEIINHIVKRYGYDNVASIITFQTFKARLALKDGLRIANVSPNDSNKITKLAFENKTLSESYEKSKEFKYLIESNENYKKGYEFSKKIEGLVRQFSTHAAGVIIANKPINLFIPVQSGYNEKILQTQYSMNHLEYNGLIKVDILGLRNLSFMKEILLRIRKNHKKNIDLSKLEFNDLKVYEIFSEGKAAGIFQFESPGMIKLLKELKPDKFEDLVASTSLFRPGPMQQIPSFIKRKHGLEPIELMDSSFKHLLESTYGIIVYQEQIIQIVQVFANFDLAKADLLRRAISKKDEETLRELRKDFFRGAKQLGHLEKTIGHVYNLIYEFANYGFNRSHAFAYSIISYKLAWLKRYYTLEFAISLLNSVIGNKNKTVFYISEFNKMGIKIVPASLKRDFFKYDKIAENEIQIGLEALNGIGINTLNEITSERVKGEFIDFTDFVVRISQRSISHTNIVTLIKGGCLDYFSLTRNTMLNNLDNIIEYSKVITLKNGKEFSIDYSIMDKPVLKEYPNESYSEFEIDAYGFSLQENSFNKYREIIKRKLPSLTNIEDIKEVQDKDYILAGELISLRTKTTKWNKDMAFATINDGTGKITITLWPGVYQKYKEQISVGGIYVVEGKLDLKMNKTLILKSLKAILEEN